MREYWEAYGFSIKTTYESGFKVEGPDFTVVRVSMAGMSEEQLGLLCDWMHVARTAVRVNADNLSKRARTRFAASGSLEKRFVNVVGGPAGSSEIADALYGLTRAGLGGFVSTALGPLVLATEAGTRVLPVALEAATSYDALHKLMDQAYIAANPPGDPDPWLDLGGLEDPLWGHHSLRRLADTVARQTMARSGATEMDIDLTFGWQERMYSQKMQHHYESLFTRDVRHRVTMYL